MPEVEILDRVFAVLSNKPLVLNVMLAEELTTSDPAFAPKFRASAVLSEIWPFEAIDMSPFLESRSDP